MPKSYVARLVYDRTHLSIAIVRQSLEVVGGITYRPFNHRRFAEIVFCAVSADRQVKGYGAHLMSHLKDYVKASSDIMHFLTCADNSAIGYFKKQGFTKEIALEKKKSHIVHRPPKEWKDGIKEINPLDVPAIRQSGWSPDMDELARKPRRGPSYNQLLRLLNDMLNHSSAWPFLVPVDCDEVTDYYDVITEPMDLGTMENKLEADQYVTLDDFIRDAKLIFDNCRKYNDENTPYAKLANSLERYMWRRIKLVSEWSEREF
ncbi:histone acetyltransferase GCN5 [Metarhizium guizhouense ARSEF 977]|uniref:histone acetyltransferase n=1 Tax=Metarhizium guizhouense (strain ARSEF 977) TaxID=1276136 RepID=A0A0B4G3D4_METGA|nr:histone acetyltransferase GCN5 [Metarhizium guizhouense ARSEF 977]